MYKVVLADDHPFIRSAVKGLLALAGHEVVAETDNGVDAVMLARQWSPDLLLLDISMPRMDGVTVIQRIQALSLNTRIIVLTYLPPEHYAARCINAGAFGFIRKSDELTTVPQAIKTVMEGYVYFPQIIVNPQGKGGLSSSAPHLIASLSNRELSVLRQLSKGMSNKDIAANIMLSNKTVSCYKARIFNKLNINSVVELADIARRHNLI